MRPDRILILLAVLLCTTAAQSQIKLKSYTSATDTFYWKRYTRIPLPPHARLNRYRIATSPGVIDRFIEKNRDQFTWDSAAGLNTVELKKHLFAVDVDGDRLPDLVYSGPGGETELTRIYLNRRDSFELVFEDYQYITEFRKEGGKLAGLQTGHAGPDAGYLFFTRDYQVKYDQGEVVFVRGKQHVSYENTELPGRFYDTPVPFIAMADTMLLRASAAQLNEPYNPTLDTFGNIIARYRDKARGVILAEKTREKGNTWYFVEVYPDVMPSASILYGTSGYPTFIRGWVSGKAVLK